MNNIFVGNISFKATKEDLQKLFEPFGTVSNVLIMEGKKGTSRGYGFVDMPHEDEKNAAIAALQGKEFMWRVLSVSPVMPKPKNELKPQESQPEMEEKRIVAKTLPKKKRVSKAWVKSQSNSKSERGDFKPSRPWLKNTGNKASKPGFKMSQKVSGVAKNKKEEE